MIFCTLDREMTCQEWSPRYTERKESGREMSVAISRVPKALYEVGKMMSRDGDCHVGSGSHAIMSSHFHVERWMSLVRRGRSHLTSASNPVQSGH
jgi:hypothetical protein